MLLRLSSHKYPAGGIVITANAAQRLSDDDIASALHRHLHGCWSDLNTYDQREHRSPQLAGCRLLSAYHNAAGVRFWVISEVDRSVTLLLPEDYCA